MDELGPEDRALIDEAVSARSPTAADRARVKQKLMAAGVLGAATGAATGAAQASGALSVTKIVSLLALVGAATGAVVWLSSPAESPQGDAPVASAEPAATAVEETQPEATVEETQPEAAPDTAEAPVTPDDLAEASETDDEPSARARRRRAAPPGPSSLADDVALLHRAQAERARDPAHALELALEHRRRFPRSPLSEERMALHVLLLCDLGRQTAAVRLGERFLARTQDSPLRRSVEESCVQR